MTLPPTAIALIFVFMIGYVACISIGTCACFANDKKM